LQALLLKSVQRTSFGASRSQFAKAKSFLNRRTLKLFQERVIGTVTNKKMALGNKKLMEQVSAKVSDELENQIIAEQKTGKNGFLYFS
jgi:cation transport ATPase